MHDVADLVAQRREGGRVLHRARIARRGEGLDEIEVVARDDATRPRRHDDEMRAEKQGLFDGVGDEEDLLARTVPDVDEQLLHLLARQAVERAERLVHEEDGGVGGERAGDADALAHAAGQFIRGGVGEVLQADQAQQLLGAAEALRPARRPRTSSPSATFSTTVFQGSKVSFWKTTPRSAPGPLTSTPLSAIEPDDSGRNPAIALSSVDFPQPDAPSATTNARSGMSSDTRSSACTVRPSRAEKKTLALSTRSTSFGLPCQERGGAPPSAGDAPVENERVRFQAS